MLRSRLIPSKNAAGFTLVEVVMSLGIFVVGIMGVTGLLFTGIQSEHVSIEQTRAVETLREAAAAISAQQAADSTGLTYSFQTGFPGGASNPNLKWTYGQAIQNLATFVVTSPDNTGQAVFVRIVPPASAGKPLGVFLSVAWPSTATCAANGTWSNAQGVQETYVTVMPPN